ncbi:MAG: hypothetical protein GY834_03400 [Bacteroidetes bacterium]|nr:hypothetical protein [Bacteroidota bacterium]
MIATNEAKSNGLLQITLRQIQPFLFSRKKIASPARNLELIKDINKYREFEFDAVKGLINRVSDIKKN